METKKIREYKPVKEVNAIIGSRASAKEILFQLWELERIRKGDVPGCNIAADIARKWELDTFGEVNRDRFSKMLSETYPELESNFIQVEKRDHPYGTMNHFVDYTGIHRRDEIRSKIEKFNAHFCYNFRSWSKGEKQSSNNDIFLKRYGTYKELGIEKEYRELFSYLKKQIAAARSWVKTTRLPLRYYLGSVVKSISAFESEKSNLNYMLIKGRTIAVENIENYEGLSNACHHGIGKLLSVDRAVYIDGERIPVKSFRSGYLLDILLSRIDWKPVHVEKKLKPVQLEECFSVERLPDQKGFQVFRRSVFDIEYDIYVMKKGISFHSSDFASAEQGWKNKIEKREENSRIRNRAENDKILDWKEIKDCCSKCYVDKFTEFFSLDKKRKYLHSEIMSKVQSATDCIPDFSYPIEKRLPFLQEIRNLKNREIEADRQEKRREMFREHLSASWTLESVHTKFGFCETGLKAFCRLNGLQTGSAYSGKELLDIVSKNKEKNLEYFKYELEEFFGVFLHEGVK